MKKVVVAGGYARAAVQLLMLEHRDALADASAEAISNIKFDKVVVWEGGGGNGTSNTASFLQSMAHMMPPMLQVMKDVGGVEMPEYFARMTGDTSTDRKPVAAEPKANGAPVATVPEPAAPPPAPEPVAERKPGPRGKA